MRHAIDLLAAQHGDIPILHGTTALLKMRPIFGVGLRPMTGFSV